MSLSAISTSTQTASHPRPLIQIIDKVGAPITLNRKQSDAVYLINSGQSMCMMGKAGTGKTTSINAVTTNLLALPNFPRYEETDGYQKAGDLGIVILAFSNKAVRNIRKNVPPELASNCMTIHKFLQYAPTGVKGQFAARKNAQNPINPKTCVIILEEASMTGCELWGEVLDAIRHPVQIIMLGDICQLAPVGAVSIYGFRLGVIPTIELDEIHRTAADNDVLKFAYEVLDATIATPEGVNKLNSIHQRWGLIRDGEEIPANIPLGSVSAVSNHVVNRNFNALLWTDILRLTSICPTTGETLYRPPAAPMNDTQRLAYASAYLNKLYVTKLDSSKPLGSVLRYNKHYSHIVESTNRAYDPELDLILVYMKDPSNPLSTPNLGAKVAMAIDAGNKRVADKLNDMSLVKQVQEIITNTTPVYYAVGDLVVYKNEEFRIEAIKPNPRWGGDPARPHWFDREGRVIKRVESFSMDSIIDFDNMQPVEAQASFVQTTDDFNELSALADEVGAHLEKAITDEVTTKRGASHHIVLRNIDDPSMTETLVSAAEFHELQYAYALTAHKAQGSEARRVFIFMSAEQHYTNEWLYTAVTRAKEHVTIITDPAKLKKSMLSRQIKGRTLSEKVRDFKRKETNGLLSYEVPHARQEIGINCDAYGRPHKLDMPALTKEYETLLVLENV